MKQEKGSLVLRVLRSEFESRKKRNPQYSLRAFARDLGVSPQNLSNVMNGVRGVSRAMAEKLAARLGFDREEKEGFARSAEKAAGFLSGYQLLDLEKFQLISDWYHLAILTLSEIPGFRGEAPWIAKRLGIESKDARAAMKRLSQLGVVQREGDVWRAESGFFANIRGVPSRAVREFHKQILNLAENALDRQETTERDFSCHLLAVDERRIEEARRMIRRFTEDFEVRFANEKTDKREAYALGVQFFRLSAKR